MLVRLYCSFKMVSWNTFHLHSEWEWVCSVGNHQGLINAKTITFYRAQSTVSIYYSNRYRHWCVVRIFIPISRDKYISLCRGTQLMEEGI